jgi:Trk K+ transport system NAD-binding subunit
MQAVIADGNLSEPHIAPHFENAQSVVCVYSDVDKAYEACRQARLVYRIENVVARVDNPQDMERFERIGVVAMNAAMDQAALLGMLARNSSLYRLLTRTDDDKDIREVTVNKSWHLGRRIRDLKLPGDLLIVALKREGEFIIPTGDTQLEREDKLSLIGEISCIEEARQIFE